MAIADSDRPSPDAPRRLGRPRDSSADEAILVAATGLLLEGGTQAVTISGVVARSGVARATVYRRWPCARALVAAVVRRSVGIPPARLTGDLEETLRRGAMTAVAIFSTPGFQALFPTLAEGMLEGPDRPGRIELDTIGPARPAMSTAYDAQAAVSGFRTDVTGEQVVDLILGGVLGRMLSTGGHPTRADAEAQVGIVLDGLRVRRPCG